MADALCLATESKPQCVIDVATLTGAIKVGLGTDIGGLFTNNDDLAFIMQSCSQVKDIQIDPGTEFELKDTYCSLVIDQDNEVFASIAATMLPPVSS